MDIEKSTQSESITISKQLADLSQQKQNLPSQTSSKCINLGHSHNQDSEHLFILNECKKLIKSGKYSKAFINLRRYLMDQDLNKNIIPEFYHQVVHTCQKLIEKYFFYQTAHVMVKVPPLMSICYQYLNLWESFLVNIQNELESQMTTEGDQINIQDQKYLKKNFVQTLDLNENQSNILYSQPGHKQSQFYKGGQRQKENIEIKKIPSIEDLNFNDDDSKSNSTKVEKEKEQNDQNKNQTSQQTIQINQEEDCEYDDLLQIKDKFPIYREQMLTYHLKTIFLSYRFYKTVNQPMRSIKFLLKGSDIVRNFLDSMLFISSADLCRIAAQELNKQLCHIFYKSQAYKVFLTTFTIILIKTSQFLNLAFNLKCQMILSNETLKYLKITIYQQINKKLLILIQQRKIEHTRGNLHMELNQIEKASEAYKYAHKMSRNSIEVWFKIIGGYSKQDIPIKFEVRCEKSIIEFITILLVQSSCYEIQNQYFRSLETLSLADWFASKLLLYDSSNHIKEKISEQYNYMKDKYTDLLQEEGEIHRILIQVDQSDFNIQDVKQKEDKYKKQKLQDEFDYYLYEKGDYNELNKTQIIIQRKPIVQHKDPNKSNTFIRSQEYLYPDNVYRNNLSPFEYMQSPYSQSHLNIPIQQSGTSFNMLNAESSRQYIPIQQDDKNFLKSGQNSVKNNRIQAEGQSSYNEQTTQVSGGIGNQTSKFHSFYKIKELSRANSLRRNSAQSNTHRNSLTINVLDNQSPNNSQNQIRKVSKTIFNEQHNQILQGVNSPASKSHFGTNHKQSPHNLSQNINNNSQNPINNSLNPHYNSANKNMIGHSNNSSFIGQQISHNPNIGSSPFVSDFQLAQSGNYGMSQQTTPRNQDRSKIVSDSLNQSNINNQNQSQNTKIEKNDKNKLARKGTLEQKVYEFIERSSSSNAANQKNQLKNESQDSNTKINSNQLPQYRKFLPNNTFNQQSIQSKSQLIGEHQNYHIQPSLKLDPINKKKQTSYSEHRQSDNRISENKISSHSAQRLDQQKKASKSQSKIGTINNINKSCLYTNFYMKKNRADKDGAKLKVITSQLYVNNDPPKFIEEPEKIEEMKQKYRFMRDDEDDVREAQIKQEIRYQFMKIPLELRYDLIDLDVCMKKIINEQLVAKTDHEYYPHMNWVCGKTLQQASQDKKEFSFARLMVQFKQKNGNGKSIPPLIEKEDTTLSLQRELKQVSDQTQIVNAFEFVKQKQKQDDLLDNQAFQKILQTDRPKEVKQDGDIPPPEPSAAEKQPKEIINDGFRGKLIKAAALQKQLDEGVKVPLSDDQRNQSIFTNINRSIQHSMRKKKLHSSSLHITTKGSEKTVQSEQKPNIPKQQYYSQQNTENDIYQKTLNDSRYNVLNDSQQKVQVDKTDQLLKKIILTNEQESEHLHKEMDDIRFSQKRIGIKDLIKTLQKKEDEAQLEQYKILYQQTQRQSQQKQQKNQEKSPELNKSQMQNSESKAGISQSPQQENLSSSRKTRNLRKSLAQTVGDKNQQSKSKASVNPIYFNLSYLKQEHGNNHTIESKTSNIAFEVDRYLNLAQSTKHISSIKLMKQNPFNISDVVLLNKLKNSENSGQHSTKHSQHKQDQQAGNALPRRFTLLNQSKNLIE